MNQEMAFISLIIMVVSVVALDLEFEKASPVNTWQANHTLSKGTRAVVFLIGICSLIGFIMYL